MRIDRLDHLVLTVASLDAAIAFYRDALGMELVTFEDRAGGQMVGNYRD